MKHLPIIFFLLIFVCCGGPKKRIEEVKPELVYPEQGLISTGYKFLFFGELGHRDRSFQEDTLVFPPIEGLVHGSAYAMCPTDTCFAEYAVLALRCPPIQPLLDWVADTVNTFIHECPIGNGLLTYNEKQLAIPIKHLKSDKEICDYYIGQLQHVYDDWHCTGEGDHDSLNEQAGLLLADCWNTGNLYTFYRIDWYDWMSCGNNARESWWTVDATSGKLLGLEDLILPEKLDTLAALMMPRLINGKDSFILDQYPYKPEEYIDVLQRANGCALIPEGLVFYFYPYNLGSSADGQYEAVIPYEELDGFLYDNLFTTLNPQAENANLDVIENDNRTRISPNLSDQAEQGQNAMWEAASLAHSHAEMWEVMEATTDSLCESSKSFQAKIITLLDEAALEAYRTERKAFAQWYDYQEVIAKEVVVDIWQLYIGGTAGGDLYELHLFDRANADYLEQKILYNALTNQTFALPYQASATMEQILSEKERLIDSLKLTYSIIDNEDNWRSLDHNAKELDKYISKDLTLFQKWISARKNLEASLNSDVLTIFSSQTGYWIDLSHQCYKGGFIRNNRE